MVAICRPLLTRTEEVQPRRKPLSSHLPCTLPLRPPLSLALYPLHPLRPCSRSRRKTHPRAPPTEITLNHPALHSPFLLSHKVLHKLDLAAHRTSSNIHNTKVPTIVTAHPLSSAQIPPLSNSSAKRCTLLSVTFWNQRLLSVHFLRRTLHEPTTPPSRSPSSVCPPLTSQKRARSSACLAKR